MSGKVGIAPCGHDGEHIVGSYVRCSWGCDKPRKKRASSEDTRRTEPIQIPLWHAVGGERYAFEMSEDEDAG